MPPTKPKPSEIAAEAKKQYIPYIAQNLSHIPPTSFLHQDVERLRHPSGEETTKRRPRVAVIDGAPVDVALDWYEYECSVASSSNSAGKSPERLRIPVEKMANQKRAGGDWESGLMAPEENLCRRSNLVHCLTSPQSPNAPGSYYPIPLRAGIYSPNVGKNYFHSTSMLGYTNESGLVIFRHGPDRGYAMWNEFKWLPVISVAPVRRPKLDEAGRDYSFAQEKELMKEKMRIVLRIAAAWNHKDICLGAFGAGVSFRNPPRQLASMWKDLLFSETEFHGLFTNVVFAIENDSEQPNSSDTTDYEIFKQEFDPSNVFQTAYR